MLKIIPQAAIISLKIASSSQSSQQSPSHARSSYSHYPIYKIPHPSTPFQKQKHSSLFNFKPYESSSPWEGTAHLLAYYTTSSLQYYPTFHGSSFAISSNALLLTSVLCRIFEHECKVVELSRIDFTTEPFLSSFSSPSLAIDTLFSAHEFAQNLPESSLSAPPTTSPSPSMQFHYIFSKPKSSIHAGASQI